MNNNETYIQNLEGTKAIEKLQELVKHNATCLFTTKLTELPLQTRPMGVQRVCDQGNFWFLSDKDSIKNHEIEADPRVQLFFGDTGNSEYLTAFGTASIITDKKKIEELWTPIAKAWFPEGKDDPRITVIKVTPKEASYWDTKNGKTISMIKIVAAAISGKPSEIGVQGELVVN